MKNRERLNHMSNEDLASWLVEHNVNCKVCFFLTADDCDKKNCAQGWKKWLESEAEE